MSISAITLALIDYGGRRAGVDRRQFSYTDHIPDGRFRKDRRSSIEQRNGFDRRDNKVVELKFENMRKGIDSRFGTERRAAVAAALAT